MRIQVNALRLQRELSARGLDGAGLAKLAGISPATVSHLLNGRLVSSTTLTRVAQALTRVEPHPVLVDLLDDITIAGTEASTLSLDQARGCARL